MVSHRLKIWLGICSGLILLAGLAWFASWQSYQSVYSPTRYDLSNPYIKSQYDLLMQSTATLKQGFNFDAAISKANALMGLGKTSAAISAWQYFIQNRPKALQGYSGLAQIYTSQGKFDLAEASWLKAIEVDTIAKYETSYIQLADLYKSSLPDQRPKIVQLVTQAMALNPQGANYPLILANYYYDTKDWASALRFYKQAVKLDPNSAKQLNPVIAELEQKV